MSDLIRSMMYPRRNAPLSMEDMNAVFGQSMQPSRDQQMRDMQQYYQRERGSQARPGIASGPASFGGMEDMNAFFGQSMQELRDRQMRDMQQYYQRERGSQSLPRRPHDD